MCRVCTYCMCGLNKRKWTYGGIYWSNAGIVIQTLKTLWNLSLTSSGAIYGQQLHIETETGSRGLFFNVKKQLSFSSGSLTKFFEYF